MARTKGFLKDASKTILAPLALDETNESHWFNAGTQYGHPIPITFSTPT